MDDTFKIFVHRLRDGHSEKIEETLPPDFLEISEEALSFHSPVRISGSATLADETLVLRLSIETEAVLPCSICNRDVPYQISIPNFYFTIGLDEIKGAVFNYKEALREGILLELPYIAECNGGDCPERGNLAKYFTRKEGD